MTISPFFHMTRTWEHDRMSHEIETTSGKSTTAWFRLLDRHRARRDGLVDTIDYLTARHKMPHRLATTLAWNYFNPSTLPADIAHRLDRAHVTPQLALVHDLPLGRHPAAVRAGVGRSARGVAHAAGRALRGVASRRGRA